MLTEDSGAHSHATWAALLRRMCRLIDPDCQTQPGHIDVVRPEPGVEDVMAGNGWRGGSHMRLVQFWRAVADELADSIVLFHVDGDVAYSQRKLSDNLRKVADIAVVRVRAVLEDADRSPVEVAQQMTRFVPLHPFRAIEAWLFHNTAVLRRLCARLESRYMARVDAWEADRTLLDEIDGPDQPKIQMPFKAEHNRELAEDGFPAEAVFAAERSFHHAVLALEACPELRASLAQTYAPERFQRDPQPSPVSSPS